MSDRFTIVFKGDIRAFDGNPLHVVSPFGEVVAGGIGDEFAVADALRAENARLREALKPFAEAADIYNLNDFLPSIDEEYTSFQIGLCRAARAAMGETE